MPKTNLCENKAAKRYDYIAGILSGGLRQQKLTPKEVSKRTGIPERTVSDRLLHPEQIRVCDLYKLCDLAGVRITFEFREIPD